MRLFPGMPTLHVIGVRFEVPTRTEVLVVELQFYMMFLEISKNKDRGNGTGELPEVVIHALCHSCHAVLELFSVDFGVVPDFRIVAIRARCLGMERSSMFELATDQCLHGGAHGRVVWWTAPSRTHGSPVTLGRGHRTSNPQDRSPEA